MTGEPQMNNYHLQWKSVYACPIENGCGWPDYHCDVVILTTVALTEEEEEATMALEAVVEVWQ